MKQSGKNGRNGGKGSARGRGTQQDKGRNRRNDRAESRSVSRQDSRSPDRQRQDSRPAGTAETRGGRANLWGAHAVRAAWLNAARRIRALYITEEMLATCTDMIEEARQAGLDRPAPAIVDRRTLDRMTGGTGAVHQGIALDAGPLEEVSVQDLIISAENRPRSVIVMLDQVTDPHNVGAIMRSACAFNAVGIVMQRRHAPELDGVLVKTASGAAEHMPVAYETNLSRTLEQLQEAGFFAIALDERGEVSLEELPAYAKAVIVMGAEGPGIRRLVKEHCDRLVRLPTGGPVGVLNVSNATAVALYALTTAK